MRYPNSQTIYHSFAGGYATDYGLIVNSVALAGTPLQVPFLLDAKNCEYKLDGSPKKIGGTQLVNTSTLTDPVLALFDFWNSVTGQKRIAYAGSTIYADNADGNFYPIFTGVGGNLVLSFSQFDDIVFIANDGGEPLRSYDGTTATSYPDAPRVSVLASHKNRLWGASGSTLYGTSADNPFDWTGVGSAQFSIKPGDGDSITAILSHKKELWIFKGPNKGSIHRLAGSGDDDFNHDEFITEGLGAIGQNSICRFRDDICFMWNDGSIHSLSSTAAFGDFYESSLTRPFNNTLKKRVRAGTLKKTWAASVGSSGRAYFTLPVDGSDENNLQLVMDFRFDPVRWSYIDAYRATCLAAVHDTSSGGTQVIMAGGITGEVRRTGVATKSIDQVSAISWNVKTPHFNYGLPIKMKNLSNIGVGIFPRGDAEITIKWRRDGEIEQSDSIVQGGGDVLGTSLIGTPSMQCDVSRLSGGFTLDKWVDQFTAGEFRSVQYAFSQSVIREDAELNYFYSTVDFGAESLENTSVGSNL